MNIELNENNNIDNSGLSFSQKVKNELCGASELSGSARDILRYGLVYGMRKNSEGVFLLTENPEIVTLFEHIFPRNSVEVTEIPKKNSVQFMLRFQCGEEYAILSESRIDRGIVGGDDGSAGLFLRGIFLTCGVITDPDREYHLELTPSDDEKCRRLKAFVNEHGMTIKISSRKGQSFLYTKESEGISDFLTYIGAMLHSMEIMNVKIFKEVRNNVNRAVNCEAANLEKTAFAAEKQIEDIELIYKLKGRGFLTPELLAVADMRRKNIDMSLRDIGEMLEPKLSRSGVNHRLKKIGEIAERLRNGSDEAK